MPKILLWLKEAMSVDEKTQCSVNVNSGERWDFRGHRCTRAGKYEHEGKRYCKQHYPPNEEKRQKESQRRFDEKMERLVAPSKELTTLRAQVVALEKERDEAQRERQREHDTRVKVQGELESMGEKLEAAEFRFNLTEPQVEKFQKMAIENDYEAQFVLGEYTKLYAALEAVESSNRWLHNRAIEQEKAERELRQVAGDSNVDNKRLQEALEKIRSRVKTGLLMGYDEVVNDLLCDISIAIKAALDAKGGAG